MTKITHVTNPRAKAFYISKKQLMWPLQNPQMSNVKMWSWDVTNVKCQILRCYTSHHRASHVTTRLNRSNQLHLWFKQNAPSVIQVFVFVALLLHLHLHFAKLCSTKCICICILQSCVPQNAFAFAFCKVVSTKCICICILQSCVPQNAFVLQKIEMQCSTMRH